jgi:hypothetical protein
MYSPPEVRELGAVSIFTLGSTHPVVLPGTKQNNNNTDNFTAFTGSKGTPCTVSNPGDCNLGGPVV